MELRVRINSVIYMFLSLLIFSKYPRVQLWARRAILAITFINVIANIYGLYHPEAFVTIMERQSALATHRSSGFYVDSNRAACVLVLGMILSIDLLPQLYRWPFIFIIFIGIFPTFSRSAPIVFLFVIAILVLKRKIYINIKSFLSVTMIGIIAWLILSSGGTEWSDMGGFESDQKFQRINRVESFDISHPDSSSAARLSIAQITWNKFQESPIWGNGIGYGLRLAELHPELDTIRSHNMYLSFMVEHGFIGALFLPLLVFFSTQNAHGSNKSISLAFGVLIITWGFFSHNILDQREFLMAFSLMSTMNVYHECNVPTRTKLSRK